MAGAALPLIIGGGLLGANVAKNKNQNLLQGALQGALLGGLGSAGAGLLSATPAAGAGITKAAATGGASAVANPMTGVLAQQTGGGAAAALKADVAAKAAASKAASAAASKAAATGGISAAANPITGSFAEGGMSLAGQGAANPFTGTAAKAQMSAANKARATSLFSPADLGLSVNPATGASLSMPTNTFSAFQAQNAANTAALDSAVGSIANPITEKIALSPGAKILATAKAKPMETMMFTSALGGMMGGGQGGGQVVSSGPITQPGGFGDVPTVEQSIGMDGGPRFVSKGLFDESKRSMEEEEMALMYQKLSEAGLV